MPITKEFYVELDLKLTTGNRDFTLVEGDTGNVIHVTLKDDGAPVDLTGCRVLAVFTKPTGSSMQDSAIEDGGVTIGGDDGNEVTIELFAASFGTGTNACELQIYSGTEMDVLVTSAAFNFYCRNGIIDDDTITSTDEYPLLTSLISQVQAIEDAVLTPSDVDGALSATSENPVQNKAVKAALDGKAASAHTHEKANITDFPRAMPPTSHTHVKANITDFPTTMAPSAHAATHATSGADALTPAAIGALSAVKVWENASPGSAFAGQTVSMDLSGYDCIRIDAISEPSGNYHFQVICPINGACILSVTAGSSGVIAGTLCSINRGASVTVNGVTFGDGGLYAGAQFATRNEYAVPTAIYGLKGVQ